MAAANSTDAIGENAMNLFSGVFCGSSHVEEGEDDYQKIAKLTVDVNSPIYRMTRKRGVCLILNHAEFSRNTNLSNRKGTNLDKDALKRVFQRMGYEVIVHNDLKFEEIKSELRNLKRMDHTENDSFVCCVLTHGDYGKLWAKDRSYSSDSLYNGFRGDVCTSLAGKPKIFLVQACQGRQFEQPVLVAADGRDEPDSSSFYAIPTMADFLVALSTVPGYFSWRNKDTGSWFIQHLVSVMTDNLNNGATEDLLSMLTRVNRLVAFDCDVQVTPNTICKQMPCFQSTLTRKVTFPLHHDQ